MHTKKLLPFCILFLLYSQHTYPYFIGGAIYYNPEIPQYVFICSAQNTRYGGNPNKTQISNFNNSIVKYDKQECFFITTIKNKNLDDIKNRITQLQKQWRKTNSQKILDEIYKLKHYPNEQKLDILDIYVLEYLTKVIINKNKKIIFFWEQCMYTHPFCKLLEQIGYESLYTIQAKTTKSSNEKKPINVANLFDELNKKLRKQK